MQISDEDLIRALYRGLLAREPDIYGLKAYLALLDNLDAGRALVDVLRNFLSSEEFVSRFAVSNALAEMRRYTAPLPTPRFSHVISLGSHCYTSWLLKNEGLKRYSLPLDWVFSSLAMATHCIDDDFHTFLDRSYYLLSPEASRLRPDEGVCEHLFYRDRFGVDFVFNHYDPLDRANYDYCVRSAERFRALLESPAPKLFLAICDEGRIGPEDFPALVRLIEQRTRNARVLVIRVVPPTGDPRIFGFSPLDRIGDHELLVYEPTSKMLGLQFEQPIDDFLMRRFLTTLDFDLVAAPDGAPRPV